MDQDIFLRRRDTRNLYEQFFGQFDRSWAEDCLTRLGQGSRGGELGPVLGEGSHFRVYRLPARHLPQAKAGGGLVLSLAHARAASAEGERLRRWAGAMERLAALRLELIPPFVLLRQGELTAWVSPYGEGDLGQIAQHWQPLAKALTQLQAQLRQARLWIDDHWQLRVWQGAPFVCDLSDLKSL